MISETENDDFELSEVVVVAEELELPDELSFLAQEIKIRLKQQQYKIILDIFFIMLTTCFIRLLETHWRNAEKRKNKESAKKYKEYQQAGTHD